MGEVERWLQELYHLDLPLEAGRFLLHPQAAQALLPGAPRSGVLVKEEGDDVWLGLYLDPADREDLAAILEETSHLLCIAWHASQARTVSRLVLELQADIDRYAFARLHGGDALAHFSGFRWLAPEGSGRAHYEVAHHTARRYCERLSQRYPERADIPELVAELRGFYRAGPCEKLGAGRA